MNSAVNRTAILGVMSAVVAIVGSCFPDRTAAQESLLRQVIVTDADGGVFRGTLDSFADSRLILRGAKLKQFTTGDLVSLEWAKNTPARGGESNAKMSNASGATTAVSNAPVLNAPVANLTGPVVLLAGGERLGVRPESMTDESVTARWTRFPAWTPVKLPLEAVRGMLINPPLEDAPRTRLMSRIMERTEAGDLVVLLNGDTVAGELQSLKEGVFKLKTNAGETPIEVSRVRAVAFNPELVSPGRSLGAGAIVTLVDGSFLVGSGFRLDVRNVLAFQTRYGETLEIPLHAIVSLQFFGARVAYLSDQEPATYKFEPYVGLTWPLQRDRSLLGEMLRLRGKQYAKGISLHSQAEATYRLEGTGGYRRFQATIGIDDETAGKGSALFRVLLDGKAAYESELLTGASQPVDVGPIDLKGAKTLTLRVEFGTLGDILDHADWCNARLLK